MGQADMNNYDRKQLKFEAEQLFNYVTMNLYEWNPNLK